MSAPEVRIRRMAPADLERVMEIAGTLTEAPHWPMTAYETALDPEGSPHRIALVAEIRQESGETSESPAQFAALAAGAVRIAGFAIAALLPPQAELETIAVALESQRRGVAKRLFAALVAELGREQMLEVILEARASNRAALGLYCSLGFKETGRRLRYYADPIEDAILMNLRVDG